MSPVQIALSATLLVWSFAAHAAAEDIQYRLTDLGDLTSDHAHGVTFVSAIGENGDIVGQSFDDQSRARAFLWHHGQMRDLGDLGYAGVGLGAAAINEHSDVVGTVIGTITASSARAFYWKRDKDRVVDLGTLGGAGTDTFAMGINGHGDVVGSGYSPAGDLRALRWVRGVPTELGTLADGRIAVQAFGINQRGDIVGYLSPGGAATFAHAFIWRKGAFTDLGTLPGTDLSFANAINERGQVVGQSLSINAPGTSRAFLWEDETMIDLGAAAPFHTSSEARAINKKGTVVGTSGAAGAAVAWVWRDGTTQDLNTLIAADDPSRPFVQLVSATGINEHEDIVAQGIDSRLGSTVVRAYLLSVEKKK